MSYGLSIRWQLDELRAWCGVNSKALFLENFALATFVLTDAVGSKV